MADLDLSHAGLEALLKSEAVQDVLMAHGEQIAAKAHEMSGGRNFKVVSSKNPHRASAAVLPADAHAINSDNLHGWLRRCLD